VKIEKKAQKALLKMPRNTAQRFYAAFESIEAGNVDALDIKKMTNSPYFRLRIGDYRAIYTLQMEVIVINAGPRGDVYK